MKKNKIENLDKEYRIEAEKIRKRKQKDRVKVWTYLIIIVVFIAALIFLKILNNVPEEKVSHTTYTQNSSLNTDDTDLNTNVTIVGILVGIPYDSFVNSFSTIIWVSVIFVIASSIWKILQEPVLLTKNL